MAKRKKKTYNLKTRIVSGIRKVWRYSPLKKEVQDRCKTGDGFFRCERCRKKTEAVDVDHVNAVVDPVLGWQGYDIFIERLFCDISNLQGICKSCHKIKTGREAKIRKNERNKIKKQSKN